jgi:hypothetical protein
MAEPRSPDSSQTSELREPEREAPESTRPSLDEIRAWYGWRLDEIGGSSVGRIEGAYVDDASGEPHWLHVRMGRFGHHTLVPSRDAVAGVGHTWVPYDRDTIRRAARIDPGEPLAPEQELELCSHYGIDEGGGRAASLAIMLDDVPSARPAE